MQCLQLHKFKDVSQSPLHKHSFWCHLFLLMMNIVTWISFKAIRHTTKMSHLDGKNVLARSTPILEIVQGGGLSMFTGTIKYRQHHDQFAFLLLLLSHLGHFAPLLAKQCLCRTYEHWAHTTAMLSKGNRISLVSQSSQINPLAWHF